MPKIYEAGKVDIDSCEVSIDVGSDGSAVLEVGQDGPLHFEVINLTLPADAVKRLSEYLKEVVE